MTMSVAIKVEVSDATHRALSTEVKIENWCDVDIIHVQVSQLSTQ